MQRAYASDAMIATDWWATGTQIGVAVATLILAGITAFMAKRTREVAQETKGSTAAAIRTAKATEDDVQRGLELVRIGQAQTAAISEQAEVARRNLAATYEPLLVPVVERALKDGVTLRGSNGVSVITEVGAEPRCWIGPDTVGIQRFFVVVPVRNVGPGPASFGWSVTDARFTTTVDSGAVHLDGRPSSPIVAAGDVVDLVFFGALDETTTIVANSAPGTIDLATVTITYSDISRAKGTVTELKLGKAEGPILEVVEVAIDP